MRTWTLALALLSTSCAWLDRGWVDENFDADGDGWGVDQDCNDKNPAIHPFAPDVRGDGCDADCGSFNGVDPNDTDGDDWPNDSDCAPDDANIFPCNPDEQDGDDIDLDCDGHDGVRDLEDVPCNSVPSFDPSLGLDPDYPPSPNATGSQSQVPLAADCW
ncbi:MAG: hypothetical protein ACI9MC_001002 [Kiritimatiellia bacterium]|jgi:hypothetical protein